MGMVLRRFFPLLLLTILGCGDSGTAPRKQIVPFKITIEAPSALEGTVDHETGVRSCQLSLKASARGNFPLNTAYWTSASFEYFVLGSNQRLGEFEWSSSQLRSFWGDSGIRDGETHQSAMRSWTVRDILEIGEDFHDLPFRIVMQFNYDFGRFYNFTGAKSFQLECF